MAQPTDIATALIHHPYRPAGGFASTQPGVFKASTVFFSEHGCSAQHQMD